MVGGAGGWGKRVGGGRTGGERGGGTGESGAVGFAEGLEDQGAHLVDGGVPVQLALPEEVREEARDDRPVATVQVGGLSAIFSPPQDISQQVAGVDAGKTYLEKRLVNSRKVGFFQSVSTFSSRRLWSLSRHRASRGTREGITCRRHGRATIPRM